MLRPRRRLRTFPQRTFPPFLLRRLPRLVPHAGPRRATQADHRRKRRAALLTKRHAAFVFPIMAWRAGGAAGLDVATPLPPPIPFNAARTGQNGPSSLSFGFGCGTSFGGNNAAFAEPLPMPGPSVVRPAMQDGGGGRAGMTKRRRNSPEMDGPLDEVPTHSVDDADEDMEALPQRSKRRRPSHTRAVEMDVAHASPRDGADVGKLLAALDKPTLLSLLHTLMSRNEGLAECIYTLIPTPSLESVGHALDALESKLRSILPTTAPGAPGYVRDEYVWSRARTTLAELAADIAGYTPFFSVRPGALQRPGTAEEPHPATAFSFLHATTMRLIRIGRMLPQDHEALAADKHAQATLEGMYTSLLPPRLRGGDTPGILAHIFLSLLREWEAWLHAVDCGVNQEGRMYGQEVVVGWERGLAALCTHSTTLGASRNATETALRRTLDCGAERLHLAVGWLAGSAHRPVWS